MEPFFSGMAIGIAILIPLVILMFALRILILVGAFVYGFVVAAVSHRRPARLDSHTAVRD
jgi:uncharacterized protein YhhL (DUF1145 family)